jgi:hypothetical protein
MMHALITLRKYGSAYWNEIPKNTTKQMVNAFFGICIVRTVLMNDPREGIIAGALSIIATGIHGVHSLTLKIYP